MAYFLAKTEPSTYSVDDFARDKTTTWDGVTNPQAAAAISRMRKGDFVFLYHSGGVSAIVGLARVTAAARQDAANPKMWVADMKFVAKLDPPTTLADVRDSGLFADFALVRQGRLSTMDCPDSFADWLRARYPKAKF